MRKNTQEVFYSTRPSTFITSEHETYTSVASRLSLLPLPSLVQGEYVSCLLSLLQQMTEIHFHHLLNNFHSKEELKVRSSCAAPADEFVHRRLDSFSPSFSPGVPAQDLLRFPQPDEADDLSPGLERHEASHQSVSAASLHLLSRWRFGNTAGRQIRVSGDINFPLKATRPVLQNIPPSIPGSRLVLRKLTTCKCFAFSAVSSW